MIKFIKSIGLSTLLVLTIACNQEDKQDKDTNPSSTNEKAGESSTSDKRLLGTWSTEETGDVAEIGNGGTEATFFADGRLVFQIFEKGKMQQINLVYWTVGDTLFSDQPSNPQVEKTVYRFEGETRLILDYEGEKRVFYRPHEVEH